MRSWAAFGTIAAALAAASSAGGCSSSPFGGSSSPFGSASNTDVLFVSASQTWDLDKNGIIACDEWKQYAGGELRQADANADGALDATEWAKLTASDKLFEVADIAYFDAGGDGKVTEAELTGKPNPAFRMLDRNGDCQIAHDEKATVYSNVRTKSKDAGTGSAGPPGPPAPGGRQ